MLELRDQAEMVRTCLEKRRASLKLQNQAARIKILAERQMGEALSAMKLKGGDRKSKSARETFVAKLKDLGISKNQSSQWQQEASVPADEFERFCHEIDERGDELSSKAFVRSIRAACDGKRRRRRRRTKPTNGHVRHQANGAAARFTDDLAEVRGHIESVDRMFRAICQRNSVHLEKIETREIPRYLRESVKILAEMERRLDSTDRGR